MDAEGAGSPLHDEVLRLVVQRVGPEWIDDEVQLDVTEQGRAVVLWRRVTYWAENGALFALQARPDRLELAEIHASGEIQLLAITPLADAGLN